MKSIINSNLNELQQRHYVRLARAHNYWVDFAKNKLQRYIDRFGDKVCLVINGSEEMNNAYILPFHIVRPFFTDDTLDPDGNGWTGVVVNNILRVHGRRIPVGPYYNAFHLLYPEHPDSGTVADTTEVQEDDADEVRLKDLEAVIKDFNNRYKNSVPEKRIVISEQVARHAGISDYLKCLRKHTCQICKEQGFLQASGLLYSETHHIIQLHELLPGSYCSDNIVVLCATCHRKLHYARVAITPISNSKISIQINDQQFAIDRNIISS